ncbi:BLUF domain containing protein [Rhabdaerophilaceae bacterium]
MLITLIYASEGLVEGDKDGHQQELIKIGRKAHANNSPVQVTGFLFYFDSRFVQILEGSFESVTSLFSKILYDPRHKNVRILWVSEINQRAFEDWSMEASMNFSASNYTKIAIKMRFLKKFVEDKSETGNMLKDLLISVAQELQEREDFPSPASAKIHGASQSI